MQNLNVWKKPNRHRLNVYGGFKRLFRFVVQPLRLQPILKGLPGDADHVADADRLEQSRVGEFIGRSAADTENGCDVIHGVCSALGRPFFVGAHKMILPC